MTPPPFTFKIPAGLSEAELVRLHGLAKAFAGRVHLGTLSFSPVRGLKFLALWSGGARCAGHWSGRNGPKHVYRLPSGPVLELHVILKQLEKRKA